jgi:hypothetical protein
MELSRSDSLPGCFTPGTHGVGGSEGSRTGVDVVEETIIQPLLVMEPWSARSQPLYWLICPGQWYWWEGCVTEGEMSVACSMQSVSRSFRTGHLERELQMVQLSATRCSCIAILWLSLVRFSAISLYVASQRVFFFCKCIFRYRLSPETFGYTLVHKIFVGISNSQLPLSLDLRVILKCNGKGKVVRWTDPPTKETYQMSVDREVH